MRNQPNGPDMVALITKIQEQIAALDKKVDVLMNKAVPAAVPPRPSVTPPDNSGAQAGARPNDLRPPRPMYRATCADCQKDCEIPFQPSGDRPVYCKECYRRRKSSRSLNAPADGRLPEAPPSPSVINAEIAVPEKPAQGKKKPAASKRSGGRKRPAVKKKR